MNLKDSLIAAVKAETDVAAAAKAALTGYQAQVASLQAQVADLQAKLQAGTIDPSVVQQELQALADSTADLASAIPAGTAPQPSTNGGFSPSGNVPSEH